MIRSTRSSKLKRCYSQPQSILTSQTHSAQDSQFEIQDLQNHPVPLVNHSLQNQSNLNNFQDSLSLPIDIIFKDNLNEDFLFLKCSELLHKKSLTFIQTSDRRSKILKGIKTSLAWGSIKMIETFDNSQNQRKALEIQEVYHGENTKIWKIQSTREKGCMVRKKIVPFASGKSKQVEALRQLSGHPFIVTLYDAFRVVKQNGQSIEIFMEHFPQNLQERIYLEGALDFQTVKIFAYQLFRGLNFIHSMGLCHRNIRASKIFLRESHLSIGDFRFAKVLKIGYQSSLNVCQGAEKPPELLLGNRNYNEKVDIWSAACVIVEMVLGKKLFETNIQQDLLIEIFKIRGSPTIEEFSVLNPNFRNILQHWKLPTSLLPKPWTSVLKQRNLDPRFCSFLDSLFNFNFTERISALEALAHPYFDEIRQQSSYKMMKLKFNLEQDFFVFTHNELPQKYKFLVPDWVRGQSK